MAFDPDEFLSDKKKPAAASGGFDPDAFLAGDSAPQTIPEPSMVAETPMPVDTGPEMGAVPQIPVSGYGPGVSSQLAGTPMGQMGQNVGRVMQPYTTAAGKVLNQYAANPLTKLAPDLAAAVHGIPPPYATSQAIGATQGAYNVGRQIMQGAKIPGGPPGTVSTAVPPVSPTQVAGNPMLAEMASRQAAAEAETLANRTIIQRLAMNKVLQTMAPALNTAARVAGPAATAYNLYEAGQMARQTELGPRLAAGQGQRAEQAFRQMNVPYGGGFTQSITQQQAQDILSVGNPRDIQAFGGTEFLRKKALGL